MSSFTAHSTVPSRLTCHTWWSLSILTEAAASLLARGRFLMWANASVRNTSIIGTGPSSGSKAYRDVDNDQLLLAAPLQAGAASPGTRDHNLLERDAAPRVEGDEMTTADTGEGAVPVVSPSRIERRRDRKVASILAAAAEVLSERGYHNLSLDEIADRLDLTKASLYHYFPSKEALVSACLESIATSANERLTDAVSDASGSAIARLTALIKLQLTIIVREQPQLAALFLQPIDWPKDYRQRARALRLAHDAVFRAVVREGIASGEFDVDENVAMHNLYGAMNYTPVWFKGRTRKDFEEMTEAVATNLLRLFTPSS